MTEITRILGVPGNVPNCEFGLDEGRWCDLAVCRRVVERGKEVCEAAIRCGEEQNGVIRATHRHHAGFVLVVQQRREGARIRTAVGGQRGITGHVEHLWNEREKMHT